MFRLESENSATARIGQESCRSKLLIICCLSQYLFTLQHQGEVNGGGSTPAWVGAFVGTIHPPGQASGLIAQLPVLGSTTTVKRFQRSSIWARIRVTNRFSPCFSKDGHFLPKPATIGSLRLPGASPRRQRTWKDRIRRSTHRSRAKSNLTA